MAGSTGLSSLLPKKEFDKGRDWSEQRIFEEDKRIRLLETSDLTKKIQFNPENKNKIDYFFGMPPNKRIVLLHSVRGADCEEPEFITKYLKEQKKANNTVYIPKIFNFQKDETSGITICNTMRYVIQNSGRVAIGYNPDSEETKFDFGIVLYNHRPVKLLNPDLDISDSVYNFMNGKSWNEKELRDIVDKTETRIYANKTVPLKLKYTARPDKDGKPVPAALAPFSAIEFGMIYASEAPFKITNLEEVRAQSDLEDKLEFFKSYSKVALKLHEIYNK